MSSSTASKPYTVFRSPVDLSSTGPKQDEQDASKRKWAALKAAFGVAAVLAVPMADSRRRWNEETFLPTCLGVAEVQVSETAPSEAVAEMRNSVILAFHRARFEFFQEGSDSRLASDLWEILGRFAALRPVDLIAHQVLTYGLPASVGAEAIRALGRVDDPVSLDDRRWLAEQAIHFSGHPALRYGAALALATIDDPEAREALEEAADREPFEPLRRNMELIVQQLGAE